MNNCVFTCLGEKCPKWVVLNQNLDDGKNVQVGKCADAWMPTLLIELRLAMDKIDSKLNKLNI